MRKKGLQAYGKMKSVKSRNSRMEEVLKKSGIGKRGMDTPAERDFLQRVMKNDKMTPQEKYNFLHDDGYYDEEDTGI